jgi:hypothetical protein
LTLASVAVLIGCVVFSSSLLGCSLAPYSIAAFWFLAEVCGDSVRR